MKLRASVEQLVAVYGATYVVDLVRMKLWLMIVVVVPMTAVCDATSDKTWGMSLVCIAVPTYRKIIYPYIRTTGKLTPFLSIITTRV